MAAYEQVARTVGASKGWIRKFVRAEFKKNPDATSTEIADKLDCDPAYVRATLRRNGLKLAGSIGRTDYRNRKGVLALGQAAKAAGLTVGDIERMCEGRAGQ